MARDFNSIKQKICKNIIKYRKAAGLTQVQLSIASSANEDYIYRIENGKRIPSLERLHKIACALRIDIIDLLK